MLGGATAGTVGFIQDMPGWMEALFGTALAVSYPFIWLSNVLDGPITVPLDYYFFADTRTICGIPFAGDVLTNAPFLLVGAFGLWQVWKARDRIAIKPGMTAAFAVFFLGVAAVSGGSAYFHWDPSEETVFWDRFAIGVAGGAIFAAMLLDRATPRRFWAYVILVASVAFTTLGVFHVTVTGDIRIYAFGQILPMGAALILAVFGPWRSPGHWLTGERLLAIFLLYGMAKVTEMHDYEILMATDIPSGHNIKHLLAAAAAAMAIPALGSISNARELQHRGEEDVRAGGDGFGG